MRLEIKVDLESPDIHINYGTKVISGSMSIRNRLIIIFLLLQIPVFGQNLQYLDTLKAVDIIDTLFIDRDINNWSLRLFTNYKDQRLVILDDNQSLKFQPNNASGVGFGVASRKIILDIAFNIKSKNREPTKRFDMQGKFMVKNSLFEFFFQTYRGFNTSNDSNAPEFFRNDLRFSATGINYMYYFNIQKYSIAAILSGLSKQKKTATSFGLGGFFISNILKADSSIVAGNDHASFNEQAEIRDLFTLGAGIRGGYSVQFALPANLFASITIAPGIGLNYKVVNTETYKYKPSNPLFYHFHFSGSFGYNSARIYLSIRLDSGVYMTDLDFDNRGIFRLSNGKFALGYKLMSKR